MLSVISLKLTSNIDTRCLKKECLHYILSFQSIKEVWGMQKAGIDLWSTSNLVLDRLQASPQQFLMLHLLHPALSSTKCWPWGEVENTGLQINPIFFHTGFICCLWDIKRQCHNWAGVEGLSIVGRDNSFRLLLGKLSLCLEPRGVSPCCPCSSEWLCMGRDSLRYRLQHITHHLGLQKITATATAGLLALQDTVFTCVQCP